MPLPFSYMSHNVHKNDLEKVWIMNNPITQSVNEVVYKKMFTCRSCGHSWMQNAGNGSTMSPFRGKLIQVHDESRLNPKSAWVHRVIV